MRFLPLYWALSIARMGLFCFLSFFFSLIKLSLLFLSAGVLYQVNFMDLHLNF